MESSDIMQLGLSDVNHEVIRALERDGYFGEMKDAYRFAIALAIAKQAVPESVTNRTNMYGRASIDEDGTLRSVIRVLYPDSPEPYRTMEMLANWGVSELNRRRSAGPLNLLALLAEVEDSPDER